jgi:N-acetylmuramoyl-L-alanine amidase
MSTIYTVQQGDHMSSIAEMFALRSYGTIWNHPQNARLKSLRQNPNVLYPGDRVYIPDVQEKHELRGTDASHKFEVASTKLHLKIVIDFPYGPPRANERCQLRVDGIRYPVSTTDGSGSVDQIIPASSKHGTLKLQDIEVDMRVGELDPVDTPTGQISRLVNLGYYLGRFDPNDPDPMVFRSAVEEFQCDNMGPGALQAGNVDGICGPRTQAKLKEVHGC